MTQASVAEVVRAVRPRYLRARRRDKTKILDEFVVALLEVWEIYGHICSKRLAPFLGEIVAVLEREGELRLPPDTKRLLVRMSPATIDQLLKTHRYKRPRSRCTTKPGTLLKHAIPIRTFGEWDGARPGFVEMDLVAHCGESTAGEYVHTLNVVDVATGWCEPVAILNRSQQAVTGAIDRMRKRLPFPLLGVDSDNDPAFLNHHLYRYCQQEKIGFTRSRPYKKNDQAHVEQKNWPVVRQLIGYRRYESREALAVLEAVYTDWRLYVNFFQPVRKLTAKEREGSKVRKRYDVAQTPYQRVLASPDVPEEGKERLRETYRTLNPVARQRRVNENLRALGRLSG